MRRIACLTTFAVVLCCLLLWDPAAPAQRASSTGISQAAAVPPVFVKMIDLVDSTRDPAGKVYRGGLTRPVNIGNGVVIQQGSPATVVLVRNGSGWNVQLVSLVIQGRVTPVTSNPGILTGAAAQKEVAAGANRANSILGRFMKPNAHSPVAAVEMDHQVVLMPGLTLSFVLNPLPVPPVSPVAAPVAHAVPPATPPAGQAAPAQAQKQQGRGWWWYCQAGPYMTGVFFYPADITTRADVDAAIQTAWSYHIAKEYPSYGGGCTLGSTDQASTQRNHDQIRASYIGAGHRIVDVDWKYVPGQEHANVGRPYVFHCASWDQPGRVYFSDAFDVPGNAGGDTWDKLKASFQKFLVEKYSRPANTVVGCSTDKPAEEGNARSQNRKIIETGWKYAGPYSVKTGH